MTRFVAFAYEAMAQKVKTALLDKYWAAPPTVDPATLEQGRLIAVTRADAYLAFLETDWSHYLDAAGHQRPKGAQADPAKLRADRGRNARRHPRPG